MMARVKRIYILIIKVNKKCSYHRVFSKRNRKHALHVSIELKKHLWKFVRTRKGCGNTRLRLVFPQHFWSFLVLPNFHPSFLNSLETRYVLHNNNVIPTMAHVNRAAILSTRVIVEADALERFFLVNNFCHVTNSAQSFHKYKQFIPK